MSSISDSNPEKQCSVCKEKFPATPEYFYRHKGRRDGFQECCKTCHDARVKKWKAENPERVKANNKKWKQENPEKVRAEKKKWVKENPEKKREKDKKWAKAHPENVRMRARKRLAQKAGIEGSHTLADEEFLFIVQAGLCCYCSEPLPENRRDRTVEHIIAIDRKGTNYFENIIIVCGKCNSSKKDRTLFIEWQPRKLLEHMRAHVENALKANFKQNLYE